MEFRGGHEVLPVRKRLEGVVDDFDQVASLWLWSWVSDLAIRVVPVLLNDIQLARAKESGRFIERRDRGDMRVL